MDPSDIWQENKRFIITVGSGLLVFLIGWMVINGLYQGDISSKTRDNNRRLGELNRELYDVDDRNLATDENEALRARYDKIAGAVAFRPRAEFRLEGSEDSAQNVYFSAVENARERVLDLASRRRAFLPDGLDLQMLTTRNVDAIERKLHALDLLERAVVMALEAGVRQIRSVDIKLDPAFTSRRGLGAIETTAVEIEVSSTPEAVTRWLAMAETPLVGADESSMSETPELAALRAQALPIQSLDVQAVKSKGGELRTRVTFLVVRIHEIDPTGEDDA